MTFDFRFDHFIVIILALGESENGKMLHKMMPKTDMWLWSAGPAEHGNLGKGPSCSCLSLALSVSKKDCVPLCFDFVNGNSISALQLVKPVSYTHLTLPTKRIV